MSYNPATFGAVAWALITGKPSVFPPDIGPGAAQAVAGNDARLTDSRTPTGTAGGDLTGTYPSPTLAAIVAATTKGTSVRSVTVTIDAKGRITALTDAAISGAGLDTSAVHSGDAAAGDLTGTYPSPSIAADAVTYAKMQNVSATDKILGRKTAGAGDPEEIDCTAAARSILDDLTIAAILTTLGTGPITYGTWTASLGGTATYSSNSGIWIKVGKLVYVYCSFQVNVIGSGSTTVITGLPYAGDAGPGGVAPAMASYHTGLATNVVALLPAVGLGSSNITFYSKTAAAAGVGTSAIFASGTRIDFSAIYLNDS